MSKEMPIIPWAPDPEEKDVWGLEEYRELHKQRNQALLHVRYLQGQQRIKETYGCLLTTHYRKFALLLMGMADFFWHLLEVLLNRCGVFR